MTIPATIDLVTAAIALLSGVLVLGISRGPGWRGMRWFAGAALCASGFALTNLPISLVASDQAIIWGARGSLFFGGLHGLCWFPYTAHLEGRPLRFFDRAMIFGGLLCAGLSLLPDVLVGSTVSDLHVGWLGVKYRDAHPTLLGEGCYVFYCVGVLVIAARLARRAWRGDANAFAQALSLGLLLLTAASDCLTAARVWPVPYLLNLGFLCVVIGVGTTIVSRFVTNARDLERSARQLREAQDRLVTRERLAAVGELSAIVAHEVRNPLGVIYNVVSQLRRNVPADGPAGPLVSILQEEAERLTRMVGALLDFARPSQPEYGRVPVQPLLLAAAESVVAASKERSPDIRIEVEPGTPDLHGDEQLIRQAIINLIDNAVQAPGRRSPVLVRADATADRREVRIAVSDDGVGVLPELQARIFAPFFTTRAQGTGLGLAIVQRIAEGHRGTVRFEPGAERGATFVLTLASMVDVPERRASA